VHSLGGLVVERALAISEAHPESYLQQVRQSTKGIIFLGTPHRGSGITGFAQSVAKIVQLVRKRLNTDILDVLKRDSAVLADVEDWFYKWLRRRADSSAAVKITSFHKELAMLGNIMVATNDSAHVEGYAKYGIHANHSVCSYHFYFQC
jgi:hypothetical protein